MQNMDWYHALVKPALTPPDAWFGIVWTVLYVMMALALVMILVKLSGKERVYAAALFLIQLGLNFSWSPLFFGAQNIAGALALIIVLWVSLSATVWCFFKYYKPAGWMMVPYWIWTSFAVYLNWGIWRLNP